MILRWSVTLMRDAGRVLLDSATAAPALERAVRARIETGDERISDLHIWQLGPGHHATVLSLVSAAPRPCADYRARLADPGLSHLTVEVHGRA